MTSATTSGGLSQADFEKFREYFYRRTGIQFTEAKRYFVDKRIDTCIRNAGFEGFPSWFAALRLDQDRELAVGDADPARQLVRLGPVDFDRLLGRGRVRPGRLLLDELGGCRPSRGQQQPEPKSDGHRRAASCVHGVLRSLRRR